MASYVEISKGKYRLYVELGYNAEGKRERKTKTVSATGPRQAEKLLKEFENHINQTLHLEDDNPTFPSFVERWKENYGEVELSDSTLEKYEEMLKVILPYFKSKKIKDIKTFHIVQFFTKQKKEGKGSLEKKYNLLNSIFNFAVAWQLIDEKANPMKGVEKPKNKKNKIEIYNSEELSLLFTLIKELLDYQQLMVELAIVGALRRGEILGIADDVLNFSKNQIEIKRAIQLTKKKGFVLKETKTEEERIVTIPSSLMKRLHKFYVQRLSLKMELGNDKWSRWKT